MIQYPHTLWLSAPDGDPVEVAPGHSVSDQTLTNVSACRYQPNGKGQSIALEDGRTFVFSGVIHAPLTCPAIETGATIEVRNGDSVITSATVAGFSRGQLHCRLWV